MVFTHAFAGAVSTSLLIKDNSRGVPGNVLYLAGILGSVLPDFDLAVLFLFPDFQHRYFLTHSLPVYLFFLLMVFAVSFVLKNKEIRFVSLVVFCGILTHLFFDFLAGGIALFAPFSADLFGFDLVFAPYTSEDKMGWAVSYLQSPYMISEAVLFILYFALLKKETNRIAKTLPYFFLFISIVMLTGLAFL